MRNPVLLVSFFGISFLNSTIKDFGSCIQVLNDCEGITYHLFTSEEQKKSYLINPNVESTYRYAPFINNEPLIIILHGYTGNVNYSPNMELRPAFFKRGTYNIISVDYSGLVKEGCYVTAAYNTDIIGMCVAQMMISLFKKRSEDVSVENTHVVGFSLGAQISGSVGKYFLLFKNQQLPIITGLDPALPLFDPFLTANPFRLDSTDAKFVRVIHSNVGLKGIIDPAGHIDFYINGGNEQPGCNGNSSCEHVRAVEIYAESLYSEKGFYGIPCRIHLSLIEKGNIYCEVTDRNGHNIILLNENDTRERGIYYIETSQTPPYALGNPEDHNDDTWSD